MPTSLSDIESIFNVSEISRSLSVSTIPSTMTPRRKSRYYNEMVVFQVEDTLFRESKRYFTANSEFFRNLFSQTSNSEEGNLLGYSDDNPIILEDVSVEEFERLLSVISPINPHEQVQLSIDEWKSVIKLSTRWGMSSLRKHCIKHLSPLPSSMPTITKILLAKDCLAVDWLVDAYNELAQKLESLTEAEAAAIGAQSAMRICWVREKWFIDRERTANANGDRVKYYPNDRMGYDYRESIRSIFRDEIHKLEME